jgi:hypothetical protein
MTPSRNVPDSRQLRHAARLRRTSGKWHIMGTMGTSKPAIRTHHCPMIDPIALFSTQPTGLPRKPGNETFTGQMGHRHSGNCLMNASRPSPAALLQQTGHKGATKGPIGSHSAQSGHPPPPRMAHHWLKWLTSPSTPHQPSCVLRLEVLSLLPISASQLFSVSASLP